MEPAAIEVWDAIVAGYHRMGPVRIEALSDDADVRDITQLDVSRSQFFVDRRYEPANGTPDGLCLWADGETLYSWDPFHPETHERDPQPRNLWDALIAPLGAVLDKEFRSRAYWVRRRDGENGHELIFGSPEAAFVMAFAGDPLTLVAHWSESPDGTRERMTRYQTTPIPAIMVGLSAGSRPSESAWFLDRLGGVSARVSCPPLDAEDVAGTTLSLERFPGRPVLVEFWATWCGKCRPKLDNLGALATEFGERVGIATVSFDRDRGVLEAFLAARQMSVPVIWDPDRTIGEAWDVSGVPTVFLLDRRHRVAAAGHAATRQALRSALMRLLMETATPVA
ncbi:MAG: TlpA disulfide reductase family protein [Nitrospiraceae bacterium]|nr:TlpA disulfide reductase family protein [Nitrospiraceae bacterium]